MAGILQGVTEWLPISSSGQNMLALMNILNITPKDAFSLAIFLHLGTLLAAVIKFRGDIIKLINYRDRQLFWFIFITTIFSGIVGLPAYLLLKENIDSWTGDAVTGLIGLLLVVTGLIIYLSKKKVGRKSLTGSSVVDMVVVGSLQGLTILPGISRSGVTVSALLLRGYNQKEALRLSFLMSIPVVAGAVSADILTTDVCHMGSLPVTIGVFTSFVFGYLTIDALLRIAQKIKFESFCVLFGLIALFMTLL